MDEIEDEGPHYLFQVEGNKILSLGGQEFYETKSFPNTDFEVIISYGKSTYTVLFEKYTHGEKLASMRVIEKENKLKFMQNSKYPNPDKFETIEGKLENIEVLFKE